MRNRYLYITLLSILGFSAEATAQAIAQAPQLVVSIAVDQLRTDYLGTYAPLYQQAGLKRLLAEGLVYPNASYSFAPVDRASATASLLTGSTPYYNGITGLEWLDRETLRPKNIVDDGQNGPSPAMLATSTLGDEMKMASAGVAKVFAFAAQPENAILAAGHAADGAVWLSEGQWHIASYYTPENQWLSWYTRQYPPVAGTDANNNITDLAVKCVEQSGIGQDDKTDLLCVAYTVQPDAMGYQMLDYQLAKLVSGILYKLPKERVLFVITGTGTTEEEREGENERYRIPTGKFYINRTANLLNMYLGAVYGNDKYVEACFHNQLYLNHQLLDKKNINRSEVLRRSQEFILQLSGVRNVYAANQLMTSDSQLLQRIRNGFNIEKCGDLIIDIQPGWELVNEDVPSSTVSRASYIPFPIIFFGADIKAERIQTPVTVDRIAPTIARTIRIRAPNACSSEPLF